jgi:beta-glucosidase
MPAMRTRFSACRWLGWLALAPALAAQPDGPPRLLRVDASAPIARDDDLFRSRHESFLARGKAGPIGLLFLGDSIVAFWSNAPRLWDSAFGQYQPANFGLPGDTTQNLIWRIEHGELDGLHPRVTVLMIGTNNSGSHTAVQIAAAIKKTVDLIRAKIPGTKVLLLAITPRGPWRADGEKASPRSIIEANWRMAAIEAVNVQLGDLADGSSVRCLDLGPRFLGPDGAIAEQLMPDQLHLSVAGYAVWAEAMKPLLTEMWAQK